MTTSTAEHTQGSWRNHFGQSRATILCLMDITHLLLPAPCCFDPARFCNLHTLTLHILMLWAVQWNDLFKSLFSESLSHVSFQTLTHEIGHIFGLKHCQWLNCVMQGSNHLEESDRRPLDFCPICLRKLQTVVGFDIGKRYKVWPMRFPWWLVFSLLKLLCLILILSRPFSCTIIEINVAMQPYFVQFKLMLFWLVQALLEWTEEDHTLSAKEASACQAVLPFPKPTEAFQPFRVWLCKCLDILGQKHDL